jgi:hypothetical protein
MRSALILDAYVLAREPTKPDRIGIATMVTNLRSKKFLTTYS